MHPFALLLASTAALFVSGSIGARTKNPRLKAAMGGAVLASLLVLLGTVAAGLWEAWSPWELRLVER